MSVELLEAATKPKTKQPKLWNVIIWDSPDHTFPYVIEMLKSLFGHQETKGTEIAKEINEKGKAVVLTTALEHAEFKRDQVHAYGADKRLSRCKGAMKATLEAN